MGLKTLLWILFFSTSAHALSIYRSGSTQDKQTQTTQITCLAGGEAADYWADAWKYMLTNSGGGDIAVIRIGGDAGDYPSWIYDDSNHNHLPKVNSVTVLSLEKAEDANDAQVVSVLKKSELIFFSGGDQSIYISWFRGSKLEAETIAAVQQRRIPIGGTSAGMALLAGIDFRARFDSPSTGGNITSFDALMDPTAEFVDLDPHVIVAPFMKNVITDTHFSQRNRHGRLMAFMAKALLEGFAPIKDLRAIAADEGTAFCYNSIGVGRVYGAGQVYMLKPTGSVPEVLRPATPLTWNRGRQAVEVIILSSGSDYFDVNHWSLLPFKNALPTRYEFWSVQNGSLMEVPAQP